MYSSSSREFVTAMKGTRSGVMVVVSPVSYANRRRAVPIMCAVHSFRSNFRGGLSSCILPLTIVRVDWLVRDSLDTGSCMVQAEDLPDALGPVEGVIGCA